MTKMKLCPIEATGGLVMAIKSTTNPSDPNAVEIYKAMTAECETVEVVDFRLTMMDFIKNSKKNVGLNDFMNFLNQNGYQIIKTHKE